MDHIKALRMSANFLPYYMISTWHVCACVIFHLLMHNFNHATHARGSDILNLTVRIKYGISKAVLCHRTYCVLVLFEYAERRLARYP